MRFGRAAALVTTLAVFAAACVEPATVVIIHVDTDLPPVVPLAIHVTARRGDGPIDPLTPPDRVWSRTATADASVDGGVFLPASFAIVPPTQGPASNDVTLRVEGVTATDVLRRTVRFTFTGQHTTHVSVFLASACLAPDTRCHTATPCTVQAYCEEIAQTCGGNGECVGINQNPTADASAFDAGCVPYCRGAACGAPDGCGGICQNGSCPASQACSAGQCVCAAGFASCGSSCLPAAMVVCRPGAMRQQACGNCGSQSSTCGPDCQWGGWGMCIGQGCAPGSTQRGPCDPCEHQTCTASCAWSGCSLNGGAQCAYQSGTNHRSCAMCACGLQYCLSSCVWSTSCVSFCGGTDSHGCFGSCSGGC